MTSMFVFVSLLCSKAVSAFVLPTALSRHNPFVLHQPSPHSLILASRNDLPSSDDELVSSSHSAFVPILIATTIAAAVVFLNVPTTDDLHHFLAQAADYPIDSSFFDASIPTIGSTTVIESSQAMMTTTSIASTSVPSEALSSSSAAAVLDWSSIFQKAFQKALGGGKAGASAAVVQVLSLMWLRTAMNYQYRYGGDLSNALKTLWSQGGIPRLYQGLPFALVQGPLTRFGDTAANVGILALLGSLEATKLWPLPLQTAFGSAAAGLWRVVLLPIDSSKTAMQVEGPKGLKQLWSRVLSQGDVRALYQGAVASAAATAVGHFPWFLTYNALNDALPVVDSGDTLLSLLRAAFLGLCASCVSDTCSNSLRVIKTTKQTAQLLEEYGANTPVAKELSWQEYQKVIKLIVDKDGLQGLFGRGLQTRLLTNAIQGSLFSVLWRYFQQVGGSSS